MKKVILSTVSVFLCAAAFPIFAEKIIIKGQPVPLELRGDSYVVVDPAQNIGDSSDYYYFTVGDQRRVCYLNQNPSITTIDGAFVTVRVGEGTRKFYCYDYNPEYFVEE